MKEVVTNYFSNLFSSNVGTWVDELLGHLDPRETPAMNELLCKEFNAQEALDSIGNLKATGVDRMPSIFIRKVGS
jgi:hypothetical protein